MFETITFIAGAGCSGKTTFLKQLQIVYDNGYTEEERIGFKAIIYGNIRRAVIQLIEGMKEMGLVFESDKLTTEVCSLKSKIAGLDLRLIGKFDS